MSLTANGGRPTARRGAGGRAALALLLLFSVLLGGHVPFPARATESPSLLLELPQGAADTVTAEPDAPLTVPVLVTCTADHDCSEAAVSFLPESPLVAVDPQPEAPGADVAVDAATGGVTVTFRDLLPDGSTGLAAGTQRRAAVTLAYPSSAGLAPGAELPIAVSATAAGAGPATLQLRVMTPPADGEPTAAGQVDQEPEPPAESQSAAPPADQPEPADQTDPASPTEPGAPAPDDLSAASITTAEDTATVGITKAASTQTIRPGEEFAYTLTGTCSSLTTPCVDFTITDTLPAEFDVTSLPQSNSQRTVTYDTGTRLLTVVYQIPVTGGSGLPAGSSQSFQIGMRLPQETPVTTGTEVDNTAQVTATGATPKTSQAVVTAEIPVNPLPIATKAWSPDTAVAQSGDTSTITLGARNASSTSTSVKQLRVSDTTTATFNAFTLTALGTVAFPPGTDQVVVEACTKPVGSPCADGDWVASGQQPGPGLSLPGGAVAADVTGLRFVFSNSGGADIPFSVDQGTVSFDVELRDTDRSTGDPIEPVSKQTVRNCASPSLVDGGSAVTTGQDACRNFSIIPNGVEVQGSKSIYPDNAGNWGRNGHIVVGYDSGVTMKVTVKNTSQVPVGTMTVIEPAPGSGAEFDKIDATKARVQWPSGATGGTMTVVCRSGSQPAPVTLTKTSGTQNLPAFGCDSGVYPDSITVQFSSPDPGSNPAIPVNASGWVEIHGLATGVDGTDVADGLRNCADVKAGIPGGASEATAQPCATTTVENPRSGVGGGVKGDYGIQTIVPGQPNPMTISFRNTGNIPVSNVVIEDPNEARISDASNMFQYVYLDSISLPASPAATLQLWDPQKSGGAGYVTVTPGSAQFDTIKTRALGFRVEVTGNVAVGATYRVSFEVMLRDNTTVPTGPPPDGTQIRNCAYIGIGQVNTNRSYCSGNQLVVLDGEYAANLIKAITPGSVIRPMPGVPTQYISVNHAIKNTGQFNLESLQVVDKDPDFFAAVTFAGKGSGNRHIDVNYPIGADRVQVDACTSVANCASDTWVLGNKQSSTTPTIPSGVMPADVKGLRVTFTNNAGGPLLPSATQPTSSACPDANVCYRASVNEFLDGTSTQVPDDILDTSTGTATKPGGDPLQPLSGNASVSVVPGTPSLGFAKGPNSRIGPGESAPFALSATNTGTGPVVSPIIIDPLPSDLEFEPVIAGAPAGQPYLLEYTLPTGSPPPSTVTFTEIMGGDPGAPAGCTDPNRVCSLKWEFPGYALPPGGIIKATFNVKLSPGVLAGQTITNTGGASGNTGSGTGNVPCTTQGSTTDNPDFGPGIYCTDPATIITVAGDDFRSEKWIKADPSLGFINAAGDIVPVTDPGCPKYENNGDIYTRYPCVARVLPGGTIDYLLRGINSGTNPAKQIVLVDGLPVQGDTGVLLSNQPRGTEWNNRPVMATPVVNVEGYPGVTTSYTDIPYTDPSFCRNAIKPPGQDTCPPGSWSASFGAANTGFQTVFTFPDGELLQPGQSLTLTWSMAAPATLTSQNPDPVAWNSFALRPTFRQPGGSLNTLPAAEPLKVGVAMPLKAFTVNKTVAGLPPGVDLDPYEFAYSCAVGATVVASGTFAIDGTGSWTSDLLPASAVCRVWETDSQGATSSNAGEENAAEVTIEGESPSVTISNTYDAGRLVVGKTVEWDAVPPVVVGSAEFEVTCTFPDSSNVLPGFPVTFTLDNGYTKEFTDLPAGTVCHVVETDAQGATRTIMVPSNASSLGGAEILATVDPVDDDGTKVSVFNLYETGGIQITKQLTGTATQWAQGPYVFDVDCLSGVLPPLHYQVTLTPGNLTHTISPIPVGYKCKITETSNGDAVASTVTPEEVTIPSYEIGQPPPGPVQVTSANDYEGGWIAVTKEVSGNAADKMAGAQFQIQVQCERDVLGGGTQVIIDETLTLADGETGYVGRLDAPGQTPPYVGEIPLEARCWATETDSVGATTVVNPHPEGNKQTVDTATEYPWTVGNVFTTGGDGSGSIRVAKTITGEAAQYAGDFTFQATCTLGGFDLPVQQITISPSGTLVGYFTGLPVGAECDIAETDNGGASSTVPVDLGTVTVPPVGQPAVVVTATNDFPAGYVTVAKELSGAASSVMSGATFTIRVQCERDLPGGGTETILDESVQLKGGESQSLPAPLPIGARCWISETNSVGATQVTLSNGVDNKATVTSDEPNLTLTAVNTYIPGGTTGAGGPDSGIKVTKVLTGSAAAMAVGPFTFTASCELGGYTLPEQTLSIEVANLVGYFSGLPVGAECAVTETDNGTAPGPVPVDLGTVTVPEFTAPPVAVTATNDFPGSQLVVAKRVVGPGSGQFGFSVTCTITEAGGQPVAIDLSNQGSGGAGSAPAARFSLAAGESKSLTVPTGASCIVQETDNGGATATAYSAGGPDSPLLITADTEVTVTNSFPAGGHGMTPTGGSGAYGTLLGGGLALVLAGIWLARRFRWVR